MHHHDTMLVQTQQNVSSFKPNKKLNYKVSCYFHAIPAMVPNPIIVCLSLACSGSAQGQLSASQDSTPKRHVFNTTIIKHTHHMPSRQLDTHQREPQMSHRQINQFEPGLNAVIRVLISFFFFFLVFLVCFCICLALSAASATRDQINPPTPVSTFPPAY